MATNRGGSFFWKVGIFEKDYEFDNVVLDDFDLGNERDFNVNERLEKFIYNKDTKIVSKFIKGNKII